MNKLISQESVIKTLILFLLLMCCYTFYLYTNCSYFYCFKNNNTGVNFDNYYKTKLNKNFVKYDKNMMTIDQQRILYDFEKVVDSKNTYETALQISYGYISDLTFYLQLFNGSTTKSNDTIKDILYSNIYGTVLFASLSKYDDTFIKNIKEEELKPYYKKVKSDKLGKQIAYMLWLSDTANKVDSLGIMNDTLFLSARVDLNSNILISLKGYLTDVEITKYTKMIENDLARMQISNHSILKSFDTRLQILETRAMIMGLLSYNDKETARIKTLLNNLGSLVKLEVDMKNIAIDANLTGYFVYNNYMLASSTGLNKEYTEEINMMVYMTMASTTSYLSEDEEVKYSFRYLLDSYEGGHMMWNNPLGFVFVNQNLLSLFGFKEKQK